MKEGSNDYHKIIYQPNIQHFCCIPGKWQEILIVFIGVLCLVWLGLCRTSFFFNCVLVMVLIQRQTTCTSVGQDCNTQHRSLHYIPLTLLFRNECNTHALPAAISCCFCFSTISFSLCSCSFFALSSLEVHENKNI